MSVGFVLPFSVCSYVFFVFVLLRKPVRGRGWGSEGFRSHNNLEKLKMPSGPGDLLLFISFIASVTSLSCKGLSSICLLSSEIAGMSSAVKNSDI